MPTQAARPGCLPLSPAHMPCWLSRRSSRRSLSHTTTAVSAQERWRGALLASSCRRTTQPHSRSSSSTLAAKRMHQCAAGMVWLALHWLPGCAAPCFAPPPHSQPGVKLMMATARGGAGHSLSGARAEGRTPVLSLVSAHTLPSAHLQTTSRRRGRSLQWPASRSLCTRVAQAARSRQGNQVGASWHHGHGRPPIRAGSTLQVGSAACATPGPAFRSLRHSSPVTAASLGPTLPPCQHSGQQITHLPAAAGQLTAARRVHKREP